MPTLPSPAPAGRPLTEDAARKRVEEEKGFYGNLASYALVIPLLAAINLLTDAGYLWFVWPMLGWGVGVVSHGLGVFGVPWVGRGWEDRRLQALMGANTSEARLRQLLDKELDERALPAGAPQDVRQLQRRIEHLEAIVTTQDWDLAARAAPRPFTPTIDLDVFDDARLAIDTPRLDEHGLDLDRLDLDRLDLDRLDFDRVSSGERAPEDSPADRVARLARRVG